LAARNNQPNNNITINATGADTPTGSTGALYILPIRPAPNSNNLLRYDPTTGEITYNNGGKTFVIDHPTKKENYLVQEGPEAGVYYRGEAEIIEDKVEISLPDYVDRLATEFTVHITPIYTGKNRLLNSSKVKNGKFTVYGEPGEFTWIVYGKRLDINVEPRKNSVNVKGDGPYKWI